MFSHNAPFNTFKKRTEMLKSRATSITKDGWNIQLILMNTTGKKLKHVWNILEALIPLKNNSFNIKIKKRVVKKVKEHHNSWETNKCLHSGVVLKGNIYQFINLTDVITIRKYTKAVWVVQEWNI